MRNAREHISGEDLVLTANEELPPRRSVPVQEHLRGCEACRSRLRRIKETLVAFVEARQSELDARLPPMRGPRKQLQSSLAKASSKLQPWLGRSGRANSKPRVALAFASLAALVGMFALSQFFMPQGSVSRAVHSDAGFAPDPALTPGKTTSLSRSDLCASDSPEFPASVSRSVALEVFRLHGISHPAPGAYELDYLIPPELGGASDPLNLWPQPYQGNPWNAYAKDAVEDRLLGLVCEGTIGLATAQRDLARDWIAAYKKYFRTEGPLVEHASFLKDEPWE